MRSVVFLYTQASVTKLNQKLVGLNGLEYTSRNAYMFLAIRPFQIFNFSFNEAQGVARAWHLQAEATKLKGKFGGLKWTRTIDLPLIRRTL